MDSGTWEDRGLDNMKKYVKWQLQYADKRWRDKAMKTPASDADKGEENHFYHSENCPSGCNFFGSLTQPIFDPSQGVDAEQESVYWRFFWGDGEFRHRALQAPTSFHMMEQEFHEIHRKEGKYQNRAFPKPPTILTPCIVLKPCDTCMPPPRLWPPCLPCLPPQPPPSCMIPYPNHLGEKEWHIINEVCITPDEFVDEIDSCAYDRDVKTCDPTTLPQLGSQRKYVLPKNGMRPNAMDDYWLPGSPPRKDDLPKRFNYQEDVGECNKRETRGPGVYLGRGFVPDEPLVRPVCTPCGYHFNETQSHVRCISECHGGTGVKSETPNSNAEGVAPNSNAEGVAPNSNAEECDGTMQDNTAKEMSSFSN